MTIHSVVYKQTQQPKENNMNQQKVSPLYWIVTLIIIGIAIYGYLPTSAPTETIVPNLDVTATMISVTPTQAATLTPTRTPDRPATIIFTQDELPTKTWPDLEQYYACNAEERQDPKTSYPWELSLPLNAETSLYHSDRWTVSQKNGALILNSQAINAAFEIREDNYAVEIPADVGVYRVNFTTKVCETDWLFVILPEENPLNFPITVHLGVVSPPPPFSPEFFSGTKGAPIPNPMADIYLPDHVLSYWMWHPEYGMNWEEVLSQLSSNDDVISFACPNFEFGESKSTDLKAQKTPPCDHGALWLK